MRNSQGAQTDSTLWKVSSDSAPAGLPAGALCFYLPAPSDASGVGGGHFSCAVMSSFLLCDAPIVDIADKMSDFVELPPFGALV
ncbi:hypothetical protein [Vreelandella nigrificans]|uniref:hypothetical protein n=1 Tax=Vreelandella nigrificans TaxID=2042704 RepID=UPI001054C167|nr:hypothetical protein [Halomonas nigrificans]